MKSDGKSSHRVIMSFAFRNGWHVSFKEADCRTPLPLKLTFATEDKIRDLCERFGSTLLEDRQALDHGLIAGGGNAWLYMNGEQYAKLKAKR